MAPASLLPVSTDRLFRGFQLAGIVVGSGVEKQLGALRAQHPDWTFSVNYGP